MKRLTLLLPGSIDQLTGGYLYARRLVDGLRRAGVAVAVIELPGRFPDADEAARQAAVSALAALEDGAVAVIDGLALAAFADGLAPAARRLRLIALVHHPLADETGLSPGARARFAALEALLLPQVAGIICPSAATAAAVAAYGAAPTRIAVALPGTTATRRATRAPAPPGTPCRLLSVATVTPRKGHPVLIAALARLVQLPWQFRLIGSLARDPAETAVVRAAIAAQGLGARVTLAGEWPPPALDAAYDDADIFVLASFHEGYGMAFAEALAHGLPIVATTGGAIPETVPGSAGLLVPPGDVAALAAALARLITDRPLRAQLAAAAAAAGARLPDWDTAVTHWLEAARRLVG